MPKNDRLASVDVLRGAVMVLMALDHVRDFVHRGAMSGSPTDLSTTTPTLFLTRWVTHFCAPVFFFTAGLGAFFWFRGHTRSELTRFLVSRGVWLIVLELTVMRFAYTFVMTPEVPVFLLVLWGLGLSMIGLAIWIWMPVAWVAVTSIGVLLLHNLADPISARQFGEWAWFWNVLHQLGAFQVGPWTFITGYSLIPWVAMMAAGFAAGALFSLPSERRQSILISVGTAATVGFVALRWVNVYGDPAPWSVQPTGVFTALSFLNTTKYPASLAFTLMTLGPALLALAWMERRAMPSSHPLAVLGRVPLFYFITHFFAAHLAIVVLSFATHGWAASGFAFNVLPSLGGSAATFPAGFGYDLWVVYVVWAVVVVGLYPVCRWFAGVKARRKSWWLAYL